MKRWNIEKRNIYYEEFDLHNYGAMIQILQGCLEIRVRVDASVLCMKSTKQSLKTQCSMVQFNNSFLQTPSQF